jgi:DNA polymerase-2
VLEPEPGLHRQVLVFDYKSLYPSLMLMFNIDPLTYVPPGAPVPDGSIRSPSGARFSREPGIVASLLARLLAVRREARERGDALASHATKILMNSFYGVLATPACRFHSSPVANAITTSGQAILHWTRDRAESLGHRVLYGDTDSLFIEAGVADDARALEVGAELAARLNADLRRYLEETYEVESRLELQFQTLFVKLFLPQMRRGGGGARKRYAGLAAHGDRRDLVFVGMESVRRDWTEAAKEFQRGLYERVFGGETVDAFIREFVADVAGGARDPQLVYKKALRKELEAYTATTPPHVRAARLERGSSKLVEYVITRAGPEPVGATTAPLDYDHYVEKQLRPIAEAILPWLGLEWDAVLGRPRQMSFF